MLVSMRVAVKCCVLLMFVLLAANVNAENSKPAKKIPKWKQEHMARVANAAKVCGSPTLNPKARPQNLTTNFYQINLMPVDNKELYLDAKDGNPAIVNSSDENRDWLLSRVGAGLYKISACVNEEPLCLTTTVEKNITLAACSELGYGDQVWWLKGYAVGANKGGWFLGNDGVGQMECLIAGESESGLALEECSAEQLGWRFKPIESSAKKSEKEKAEPYALAFPKGADLINYQCDSNASVSTYYDEQQDKMFVRYKGQTLQLNPTQSGSGAKFGDASQPWGWWTKADSGSIYQTNGDEIFIENCKEVKENQFVKQQERVWSAQAFEGGAAVSDCTDCEEEHELVIRCKKNTLTAEVNVWINADDAVSKKQFFLEVDVDNRTYHYPFEAEYYEMIGHHIAKFEIHKNDSIFDALKQANNATFRVANDELKLGLVGSKKAIDSFKSNCGWI